MRVLPVLASLGCWRFCGKNPFSLHKVAYKKQSDIGDDFGRKIGDGGVGLKQIDTGVIAQHLKQK